MHVIVQQDGVYYDQGDGREIKLEGVCRVDPVTNVVTVRFPARDVIVREPFVPRHAIDMSDVVRCAIAVRRGGLTLAQIAAVRPGVAMFLQNQGIVPGDIE